jgi:hypothetical protein
MENQRQPWNWIFGAGLVEGVPTVAMALVLIIAGTPSVQAQSYRVIHNFSGGDGANPYAGLTIDARGNLYGTTSHSAAGYGSVFQLKRSGTDFTLNPLYSFTGGRDGIGPYARVVFGPGGTFYGSTVAGGHSGCNYDQWVGCGTVFKLRPPATACKTAICAWSKTVL